MNCRFAKITVKMLGADAPMNANVMNNNRGKLLAAVAVLAMIACVFVAVMPADNAEATDTSGVNVPANCLSLIHISEPTRPY